MVVGPLLQHSEEFRSYFTTEFDRIDNHVLTETFRADLIGRYRLMADRFEIDPGFLEIIDRFLERRPEALRRQFESLIGLGASI